jgi:hypothetical protein
MRVLKTLGLYILLLALIPFLILEGAFRLLPVSDPPALQPVNARDPYAHFEKNVRYVYSAGWDFAIVSHKRSNNYGYANLIDYDPKAPAPLFAVIGDSFVEAHEVDAGKSAAELLHKAAGGRARVYSFGLSGGALPQYLAYARYAHDTFHPRGMAFVIIGNDFDESLLKYAKSPRLHHFDERGRLVLTDYRLAPAKQVLRHSAFIRYVMLNMISGYRLDQLRAWWRGQDYDRVTPEMRLRSRLPDSKQAVDWFFARLPEMSGLRPSSIVFVVDALRPAIYSEQGLAAAHGSYEEQMRDYLAEQARARGYEVIDLNPVFRSRYQREQRRFEFPTDKHWNELGHRVVAEELVRSGAFTRITAFSGELHDQ